MAVIETWFEQDLQKPVKVRYIDGNLFSHNDNGNRIGVVVTNNGEAVTLTGTVSGYAVLADGTTVPCTGTRSGNKASILVPAAAYSPGRILISIFLTDGTTVTTLAALSSSVIMARTGNQIDPGSVVTDWTNTINAAMQSVETAAANLGNIVATPYANLTFPVPLGKYTIYNNGLYRCISPIASSEAWTAAHWKNVKLGDDVTELKSAITMIGEGSVLLPVDSSPTYRRAIYSDGTWGIATGGNQTESVIIPIPIGAKKITVVCASNETIIAFLKTFTGTEADGSTVDFASHYTARISISANTTGIYTLYGDENYIFVLTKASAGANRLPQSVTAFPDILIGTDKTLSISGMAADAETVGKLANGTYFPQKGNAATNYTHYEPNKYAYSSTVGGGISYQSNSDYGTVIVPVDELTHYTCNRLRYLTCLDDNLFVLQASAQNVEEFDTITGTKYVAATFYNADNTVDNLIISAGDELDPSPMKYNIPWLYHPPYDVKISALEKSVYRKYPFGEQYNGNDQSKVLGTANSIKKGKVINFSCDFSTFGTLHIKLQTAGGTVENDFAITSTTVTRTVDGNTRAPVTHGLTIQNTIGVQIEFIPSGLKFKIISNGAIFEQTYDYASGSVVPAYEVSDMTISNVDFAWSCKDFADGIWLFGDSYFSYGTNRWVYYLIENGYGEHCLIDGYPGETSIRAIASLKSYISLSTPKYAVWCLGMNDGSDGDAPSSQWLTNVQEFLLLCNNNNITPVLATIPTVPTINHERKSAWVRESGYQYIDFAKAVGASTEGWFAGMLASDGVHPTVSGAMALYHRAMTDCPQLFNRI